MNLSIIIGEDLDLENVMCSINLKLHLTDLVERRWDVGGDDLSHGEGDAHHNQQLSVQS